MTDIIERLKEPESHYPGNFDTPKRANAMLSCLCQEAAEEIESMRQQLSEKDDEIKRLNSPVIMSEWQELHKQLAASQAREQQLRENLEVISGKRICVDNCLGNVDIAKLALAIPQDTTTIEAMIAKAGEVMRERCATATAIMHCEGGISLEDATQELRALPAITMDDLK